MVWNINKKFHIFFCYYNTKFQGRNKRNDKIKQIKNKMKTRNTPVRATKNKKN